MSNSKSIRISNLIEYTPLKTNALQHKQILNTTHKPKEILMVDQNTYVGLEVEVENCKEQTRQKNPLYDEIYPLIWRREVDNSLRNDGLEFISYPIKGEMIPLAIKCLEDVLTRIFPKHQFTPRTSVHVHVNCRHMSTVEFVNLMLLYLVVEPIFYYLADDEKSNRTDNNFCVPIEASKYTLNLPMILENLMSSSMQSMAFKLISARWKKYNGLNLLPLHSYGTIEFRQMRGTINPTLLIRWINMILSLKKYAIKTSVTEIKEKVFDLNTISSYMTFICDVLGEDVNLPVMMAQEKLETSSASLKEMFAFMDLSDSMATNERLFQGSSLQKVIAKSCPYTSLADYRKEQNRIIREYEALHNEMSNIANQSEEKLQRYYKLKDQYMKLKANRSEFLYHESLTMTGKVL